MSETGRSNPLPALLLAVVGAAAAAVALSGDRLTGVGVPVLSMPVRYGLGAIGVVILLVAIATLLRGARRTDEGDEPMVDMRRADERWRDRQPVDPAPKPEAASPATFVAEPAEVEMPDPADAAPESSIADPVDVEQPASETWTPPVDQAPATHAFETPGFPSRAEPGDVAQLTAAVERLQATVAGLPNAVVQSVKAGPSSDLSKTLKSIQALLRNPPVDPALVESLRTLQTLGERAAPAAIDTRVLAAPLEALVARLEAHERNMALQLTAIVDRLGATAERQESAPPLMIDDEPALPHGRPRPKLSDPDAAERVRMALDDIRRAIDGPAE